MVKCTVSGHGKLPALPLKELNILKQDIFELFPKYWPNASHFESLWKECADAIGQCCKRLQKEEAKKKAVLIE